MDEGKHKVIVEEGLPNRDEDSDEEWKPRKLKPCMGGVIKV